MNQVLLIGRIVRPIDLKAIGDGHRVVNNTLAVSRNQRDKNGETVTDFIPIVAWNRVADLLDKYGQKGQRVALSGMMQSRTYTNNSQQSVYVIECVVEEVTLLDRPQSQSNSTQTTSKAESTVQ